MTPDPPNDPSTEEGADDFKERMAQARHDLRNPLAHILGFSEILIEKAHNGGPAMLKQRVEAIYQTADRLVREINRCLDLEQGRMRQSEAAGLKDLLRLESAHIIAAAEDLARQTGLRAHDPFSADLIIIAGAGRKLGELTETALEFLIRS